MLRVETYICNCGYRTDGANVMQKMTEHRRVCLLSNRLEVPRPRSLFDQWEQNDSANQSVEQPSMVNRIETLEREAVRLPAENRIMKQLLSHEKQLRFIFGRVHDLNSRKLDTDRKIDSFVQEQLKINRAVGDHAGTLYEAMRRIADLESKLTPVKKARTRKRK